MKSLICRLFGHRYIYDVFSTNPVWHRRYCKRCQVLHLGGFGFLGGRRRWVDPHTGKIVD